MQPLVQWQKISFAQAAALTWSISRFSFLGRGERDLIQKCLGMAYIGCSCWFKRRPEFSSISKYVCVWKVCVGLSVPGSSFLKYFSPFFFFCSLHRTPIPLKPRSFSFAPLSRIPPPFHHFHWLYCVSTFKPFSPPLFSSFTASQPYIYLIPTITFSSRSVSCLTFCLSRTIFPKGWAYG